MVAASGRRHVAASARQSGAGGSPAHEARMAAGINDDRDMTQSSRAKRNAGISYSLDQVIRRSAKRRGKNAMIAPRWRRVRVETQVTPRLLTSGCSSRRISPQAPNARPVWNAGLMHRLKPMCSVKGQIAFRPRFQVRTDTILIAEAKHRLDERISNAVSLTTRFYAKHAQVPIFPINRVHCFEMIENTQGIRYLP